MKKLLILASLVGLLALAAVAGALIVTGDASQSIAGSNRIVIVKSAVDSIPLSGSALDSRGARVVGSWSDARAAVDETTKAIIFTESTLPDADRKWVQDNVHAGMVVGAFNVSPGDLAAAFGLYGEVPAPDGSQPPPVPELNTAQFGDDVFFSLVLDVRTGTHIRRGGMAERFLSTDAFLAHVERYIRNSAVAK